MRACWLKWVGRDWSISADYIWLNYSDANIGDVVRAAMFDDAAGDDYEIERCPRCGSTAVVKKGKSKNGDRRYLCRGCGRTFSGSTGRVLGRSRLPRETWMAYAECFALVLPLRECAARCGVCLKTAWTMRLRLIECLRAYSPDFRVGRGGACELDETYFPESFKGNHSGGSFEMPRKARHRGKEVHRRGLSREQICVMTGISDTNATFFEVSGRGVVSRKRAAEALRGRIGAGAVVATDKATAYVDVLRDLKVASHESYDSKDRSGGRHQPHQHRPFAPRLVHGPLQGSVHQAPRRLPRLVPLAPHLHGDRLPHRGVHGRTSARQRNLLDPHPRHVQRPAALYGLLGRAGGLAD